MAGIAGSSSRNLARASASGLRPLWISRILVVLTIAGSLVGPCPASATALPVQGVFESCPLDLALDACTQRLAVMHRGRLQVVVMPATGASLTTLSEYAAAAHDLGMSIMWEIGAPSWWRQPGTSAAASFTFQQFALACGCTDNARLLAYTVRWLSNLPATYGYYAADDSVLQPGDRPGIAAYIKRIKQQDPVHPLMIGAFQSAQRRAYMRVADLVGQEEYPVIDQPRLTATDLGWVGKDVLQTQHEADSAGRSSAFILQAFTWGDSLADGQAIGGCSTSDTLASCSRRLRYPTGAEQLALRNAVLRHAHPRLVLWYSFPGTYGSPDSNVDVAYPSAAEAAVRWAGLASAIKAPPPAMVSPVPVPVRVSPNRVRKRRSHHPGHVRHR